MKKLNTHIKGLDALFHGGIQVESVTNETKTHPERDSLIIVIKGSRGVNKHLFALQLMHGLGISIFDHRDDLKKRLIDPKSQSLRYYSINKPTHLIDDLYLDLLIERWISHTNIEYKELALSSPTQGEYQSQKIYELQKRSRRIMELLFNKTKALYDYEKSPEGKGIDFDYNLPLLIASNIIGYNARTNSIHLRNGLNNDDNDNLLLTRSCDSIREYYNGTNEYTNSQYEYSKEFVQFLTRGVNEENNYYKFSSEFLNICVNRHLTDSAKESLYTRDQLSIPIRNANSARVNFFAILSDIEATVEEAENAKDHNDIEKSDLTFPCEVTVIDGFSHISEKDLQTLPYNYLLGRLRKMSRISILVFEDTQTTMPDGDIEIEIRSQYDEQEAYTYNQIRISKCVNQLAALGWHLYKRQESHIRIYPSMHLRLFKRSYINNQMHEISRPIIQNSYAIYLDSLLPHFKECDIQEGKLRIFINNLKEYLNKENNSHNILLEYTKDFSADKDINPFKILDFILKNKWMHGCTKYGEDRKHSHRPITAIVGNPNSFKRNLAMYSVFANTLEGNQHGTSNSSEKGICHKSDDKSKSINPHVLIVLLDKDLEEMRKKILCPALASHNKNCEMKCSESHKCSECKKCSECYKRISFLNVNAGCITPEEFCSMIHDHIRVYTGKYNQETPKKIRPLHIIIDDFQMIDFSYPFLSSSKLFTNALISLCEANNVSLTILCDKNSRRVREVCTLADYVLCVRREEKDTPNKIELYVEKMGDYAYPSVIMKYDISDVLKLMKCNGRNLSICPESVIYNEPIGSMKEYWRQTYNVLSDDGHKSGKS